MPQPDPFAVDDLPREPDVGDQLDDALAELAHTRGERDDWRAREQASQEALRVLGEQIAREQRRRLAALRLRDEALEALRSEYHSGRTGTVLVLAGLLTEIGEAMDADDLVGLAALVGEAREAVEGLRGACPVGSGWVSPRQGWSLVGTVGIVAACMRCLWWCA